MTIAGYGKRRYGRVQYGGPRQDEVTGVGGIDESAFGAPTIAQIRPPFAGEPVKANSHAVPSPQTSTMVRWRRTP